MLTCINQLNEQQLNDLNHLITQCRTTDGSTPNVYPHLLGQYRTLPANCLYYENDQLLAFISAFFFYEDACEVSVLVAPTARRKGLASQLLQTILPLVHSQGMKELIFSSPHQRNNEWLTALGFKYQLSEYHMERYDLHPVLVAQQSLTFRNASTQNLGDLCLIDEACFPKEQSKMVSRFNSLLNDRHYQLILAYKDGLPVGKAHIRWQTSVATFSDIGVLPELQGKGLGTALLAHCINYSLAEGKPKLDLDVETRNLNALNLYSRLGFTIQNACDYWMIPVHQLPQRKH